MSEKGQVRKSMFLGAEYGRNWGVLYESDTPVLAYDFKRRMVEGWDARAQSTTEGKLVALTQGLLIVETENERWLFSLPAFAHGLHQIVSTRRVSVGGAAGSMVDLSPEMCRGLPKDALCVSTRRSCCSPSFIAWSVWDLRQPLDAAKKALNRNAS